MKSYLVQNKVDKTFFMLLQYLRNNITNISNNIFHLKTVQALGGRDLTSLDFSVSF